MMVFILALIIVVFSLYLGMLFFQFTSIERKLEKTVETIEVYLLQEFGELSHTEELELDDEAS